MEKRIGMGNSGFNSKMIEYELREDENDDFLDEFEEE